MKAMENWGAITFSSKEYEGRNQNSFGAIYNKYKMLAHEIAHMWFGNLVTCKSWNEIWLNEGFARYFEYKSLDSLKPEFFVGKRYLTEVHYYILGEDIPARFTHPLITTERNISDSCDVFDLISYSKGAAIVGLLEDIIGEQYFIEGLREYIKKFQYKNVTTEDFIQTMTKVSGFPVADYLDKWLNQSSFPLVTFKRISETEIIITQNSYDRKIIKIWPIYIKWISEFGSVGLIKLDKEELIIPSIRDRIKLNYMGRGYYRVLYENYSEVLDWIKNMCFEDRYSITNDIIFHIKQELIEFDILIRLINGIVPEFEYLIIKCIMNYILELIENTSLTELLIPYVRMLLMPVWEKYGFESHNYKDNYMISLKKIAYVNLVEICKFKLLENRFLALKNPNMHCKKLYQIFLINNKIKKNIVDCICIDPKFSSEVMKRTDNICVIQFIISFYGALFDKEHDCEILDYFYKIKIFEHPGSILMAIAMERTQEHPNNRYLQFTDILASRMITISNFTSNDIKYLYQVKIVLLKHKQNKNLNQQIDSIVKRPVHEANKKIQAILFKPHFKH